MRTCCTGPPSCRRGCRPGAHCRPRGGFAALAGHLYCGDKNSSRGAVSDPLIAPIAQAGTQLATLRPARPRHRRLVIIAILAILAASLGLRLINLTHPAEYMFDEVYYAKDAKAIVEGRVGTDGDLRWAAGDSVSWPHPEAGKFAIAAGIILFGDRALGWRLPAVLAGMVILACVYPIARRLGLSPSWSIVALLFAAADPLGITQSRIATLDIFVATWTVVCLWLALRAVQSDRHRTVWLLLCGVAGGLALSTKWSGALALAAAAFLVLATWWGARRAARAVPPAAVVESAADGAAAVAEPGVAVTTTDNGGGAPAPPADVAPMPLGSAPTAAAPVHERRGTAATAGAVLIVLAAFVLIPAIVYMACYTQYFVKGHTIADWWELHRQMWTFGLNLHAEHSYASRAPSWIIVYRPVWYYFDGGQLYRGVIAIGNPLLWWSATLALLAAPVLAFWGRRPALLATAAVVVVLYVPWFATSRTAFLYYMTPVAPFLAVLVAAALALFTRRSALGPALWLALGGAAVATALLWEQFGRFAEWLFWTAPREISPVLPWVAIGAGIGLALLAAALLTSRRLRRTRPWTGVLAAGAITGIVVCFIPVVLALPITQEQFSRITWFASWI